MPALSAVLLIFIFSFSLLFFNISLALLDRTNNTQYRTSDVAENLGRYISCTERTFQGNDSNGKMETRHPIYGTFGSEFLAVCNLWQPEFARPWNFVSNFCVFLEKRSISNCAIARIAPKICQASQPYLDHIVPDFILMGSLSSSYCRTRKENCPVEYFQYRLFDTIIMFQLCFDF